MDGKGETITILLNDIVKFQKKYRIYEGKQIKFFIHIVYIQS